MNFEKFSKSISKIVKEILPGELAHHKMAPPERNELIKNSVIENYREAAVLILFYPKNSIMHMILILRASYSGTHSSQVAFPGGKVEKFDLNFEQTALRETYEEIGIHSDLITVIRPFSKIYIPPSNFMVYPFMGYCKNELKFNIDPKEVAGLIEFPLSEFLENSTLETTKIFMPHPNQVPMPGFSINEYHVWGATAMMLNEVKFVLKNVF